MNFLPLPITAIVVTKNEEHNIGRCLKSLQDFSEVIVVDSNSIDNTKQIAESLKATFIPFTWNKQYPKKRQWCLDTIQTKSDWVFFIDADEETTPNFVKKLRSINWNTDDKAGYFVQSSYVINDKILKHGLKNNKLCLLHKNRMQFPIINDLNTNGIKGMGELEGHYQPVPKTQQNAAIGQIKAPILHHAMHSISTWKARHERYALWEISMDEQDAWPRDPSLVRQLCKTIFKAIPGRPWAAFLHSYFWKWGILDGKNGWALARSRHHYYTTINALKNDKIRDTSA